MSIQFKRAFSSNTNIVVVGILLIVAIVSLVLAINPKLLPFAWVSNVAQVSGTSLTVVDGDGTTLPSNCLENASLNTTGNPGGSITLSPTKWAGPIINIGCAGRVTGFNGYDTLEFDIMSTSATIDQQKLTLRTYDNVINGAHSGNADSQQVTVPVTSSWNKVSIPISSLQTASWNLNNVYQLLFVESQNGTTYFIDNIVLKPAGVTPPPTPVPVVSLSASPTTVNAGQSATLSWSSTNSPTSCTASGGWSGALAGSGSQTVTPTVTTTYNLSCANAGGTSVPASATISVNTVPTYQKVTVLGWTPPSANPIPGASIPFTLNWIGGSNYSSTANIPSPKIGGPWSVFVHIENVSTGKNLTGADFVPSPAATAWSGTVSTPVSYTIPANAPAGTYNVFVGLYAGQERLPLQASGTAVDAGAYRYKVGTFSVTTASNQLVPVITSISIPQCIQGAYSCRQEVKGSNFDLKSNDIQLRNRRTGVVTSLGINGVNIGNMPSANGTSIVVDVPATISPDLYDLTDTVKINGKTLTSNAVTFEMWPISVVPAITSVTPTSGPYSTASTPTRVTITGTHFVSTNDVQIGPYFYGGIVPNASGALVVTIPTTGYASAFNTPLKVTVENDTYGSTADNPSATPYTFTITGGTSADKTPPVISSIASTTSTNSATISWTTNEDADTQVFYGTTIGYGSQTTLIPIPITGGTNHSTTISGLAANTRYYFSVQSKDAAGNIASSSARTFTTQQQANPTPPAPPTNVTATAVSSSQINLSWSSSLDVVAGYKVYRNGALAGSTTTTAFTNTGLAPSTAYSYVVKSYDATGNTSASSTMVTATTQAASGAVTATLTSDKTGVMYGEQAVLTWSSTNATACTATDGADDRSDGWAGTKATSGTLTVSPSISTGYSIACTGPGGTSPKVTVVILHTDGSSPTDVTYIGLSALVQKSPAQITLSWYPDNWNQSTAVYTIYRSTVIGGPSGGAGSWTQIGSGTNITSYVDTTVSAGTAYEYRVNRANTQHNGDAYIYTGIELPQVTNRGKLVLLVDSRFTTTLATQIDRLKDDLVGDGWDVLFHSVPSGSTPDSVKTTIKTDYAADPTNVKAVFLLGHIPVFRSGSLNPDGHAARQMPADGFYGDMDGTWSSTTTYIPSDIELEVGRVDMYDMPAFAPLTEADLLTRYLDKDHAFRTKAFDPAVYTNPKAAAMTSSTNSSYQRQFFGAVLPLNIESIYYANLYSPTFWNAVENNSYLWFSRGGGGGQYTGATGVGYSSDFASSTGYKVVFNSMFASWFVEWDVQNNFLRAPLAAKGYALTNAWSDNPAWVFVHMGLGKEIGFSAKTSQNNNTYYNIPGYIGLPNSIRGVHMNLMGDPTLRMQVVAPVTNVARTDSTGATALTWGASPDAGRGYNVYRSANGKAGPFTLITTTPVTGTTYTDSSGGAQYTYMVRAVKLEVTPSGSYVNQSQGVFAGAGVNPPPVTDPDLTSALKIWDDGMPANFIDNPTYGSSDGHALIFSPGWSSASLGTPVVSVAGDDFLQMSIKLDLISGTLNTASDPQVWFYSYAGRTQSVSLKNYIVGTTKTFSTTYQTVRIPIADLIATDPSALGGLNALQQIYFVVPNSANYKLNVDYIYSVPKPGQIKSILPLSSSVLKVTIDKRFATSTPIDPTGFTVTSGSTTYSPVRVGREFRPVGFEGAQAGIAYGNTSAPIIEGNLYLIFDRQFSEGATYNVSINKLSNVQGSPMAFLPATFTFRDKTVTGTVKASQVGYSPAVAGVTSPKFAYIGNYLGDTSPGYMDVSEPNCYIVNDSSGVAEATTYPITLRGLDTHLSGEKVFNCDFSAFNKVGRWYIYVPGYGRTYSFDISSTVYNSVARTLARFFYLQRADIPIIAGEWSRPAGSLDTDKNAIYHSTNFNSTYSGTAYDWDNKVPYPYTVANPFSSTLLPAGTSVTPAVQPLGGWYDAGDYGKYVHPARPSELMFAYELYPEKFTSDANGLSNGESGDTIPDILNEIKWEIDWLKTMQYSDGSVFDRVEELKPWAESPYDTRQRYIYPRSTYTTAVFAAEMAQAYRIFKNNPQFEAKYNKGDVVGETYADSLLVQAKKAWDYLAAHPTPLPSVVVGPNPNPQSKYIPSGTDIVGWGGQSEYQSPYQNSNTGTPASDVDERAWAAAELYKATGLSMYSTAFDTYWSKTAPLNRIDSKQFYRNTQASLAYVTTPMHTQYPTDPVKIAAIKAAWKGVIGDPDVASGDDEYHWTYANKYRNAYRSDVDDYIGWGNYAHAAKYAFDLIIGYKLLGDARYLDAAKINLDVQLGSNPQYVSYITGVGAVPPKHPLSMTSVCLMTRATCIKDTVAPATKPMPGIPVYGPHVSMSEGYDAGRAAQDDANLYPSIHANTYPMLRRYFDIGSLVEQSEYAMANIPPLLAAYAYFSN